MIDPEFGFFGRSEFDLGVMLAHLTLARRPDDLHRQVVATYQASSDFDRALVRAFTGGELLRRLLGLAQLPLAVDLDQKREWLDEAVGRVMECEK